YIKYIYYIYSPHQPSSISYSTTAHDRFSYLLLFSFSLSLSIIVFIKRYIICSTAITVINLKTGLSYITIHSKTLISAILLTKVPTLFKFGSKNVPSITIKTICIIKNKPTVINNLLNSLK